MSQEVHTRLTKEAIARLIRALPQELRAGGSIPDAVMQCAALALLGRIHKAFLIKSRGGTDEAGDRWAPLKPATIAYGRIKRGKRESARNERPSQALTKKQQAQWWTLYRQGLAMYRGNKASAARRAWGILKRSGAQTLIRKYGSARVSILNDSGQLLRSLTPGSGSGDQIIRVQRGGVSIGTSRPGAMAHHNGSPSRGLPQRKLWPDVQDWPQSWWQDITREIQRGLVELLAQKVK